MEQILKSLYKIQERITETPYSITYKGQTLGAHQPLIIKIFRRNLLNNRLIQKLKEKAAFLAQLSHPNVAKFLDGDYGFQGFYFVREYVEGKSLGELLKSKKALEEGEIVVIAAGIAEALSAAHNLGLPHGSLTPFNVFLASDHKVKVTDFGIQDAFRDTLTQRAIIVTTEVSYLSPEQIRGEATRYSSDIYAAGLLLYQMIAGSLPFSGRNNLEIALQHLKAVPPCPSNPRISKFLADIALKALEKDPWLRFSSAQELSASLKSKALIVKKTELDISPLKLEAAEFKKEPEIPPPQKIRLAKSESRTSNLFRWILVIALGILAIIIGYIFSQLAILLLFKGT